MYLKIEKGHIPKNGLGSVSLITWAGDRFITCLFMSIPKNGPDMPLFWPGLYKLLTSPHFFKEKSRDLTF